MMFANVKVTKNWVGLLFLTCELICPLKWDTKLAEVEKFQKNVVEVRFVPISISDDLKIFSIICF